jgi:hypothetical protein
MPSFDVVSKVELAELDNAIQQSKKELESRYDFKGHKAEVERQPDNTILMKAASEERVDALRELVFAKLAKRGISLLNVEMGKLEAAGHQSYRQTLKIVQGIPVEKAKKLAAAVRDSKIKVQASIQGDSLRVSGKNRDDLQATMRLLRAQAEPLAVEIQFDNFRD